MPQPYANRFERVKDQTVAIATRDLEVDRSHH